jgi:type IX secretion system PorP/SprF family membrane protein
MIVGLLSGAALHAQSDFDFTQRWFNESLHNPAAVGNSFSTGFFLHSRTQWLGLDRAPLTIAGVFDYYSQNLRSGFGLTAAADYIGVKHNYYFRAAYTYFLDLGDYGILSMGLSGGVFIRGWHIQSDYLEEADDFPALIYNEREEYTPDFDFGLEYKGAFKLGVAIRHVGAAGLSSDLYPPDLHIWSYLSSRFNLSYSISIEPLVAFTWRANIHRFEGGFLFYFFKIENLKNYNDRFWIGAVYRTDHNIAFMAGINLTSQLRLGYSFDYGFDDVAAIAKAGTHEVFIAWQFNRKFYKEFCCPWAYN